MNASEIQGLLERLDMTGMLTTFETRAREAEVRQPPYRDFLLDVLNEAAAQKTPTNVNGLRRMRVGPQARWFQLATSETAVDLGRRGPVRRILLALVDAHAAGDERTLDVDAVIAAGWPDEHVRPDAGATRVYTAIRTLRRMGLDGILLTRDSGYLIDPRTHIERFS